MSIDIITTIPNYLKSNGLAEKGVDITNIFKMCQNSKYDINLCLLDYRNSWVVGLKVSPIQLLIDRMLRNRLPVEIRTLKPGTLVDDINISSKQAHQYNKNCQKKCEEGKRSYFKKSKEVFEQKALLLVK